MIASRWVLVLAAVLPTSAGCRASPAPQHDVRLAATSDDGSPLAGVRFSLGADLLAVTDGSGRATARVEGREGRRISVLVRCPEGFRSPDAPLAVRLGPVARLGSGPEVVLTTALCRPERRRLAIVARVLEPSPARILVDGVERARTDATGTAHALVTVERDTTLRVDLESPGDAARTVTKIARVEDEDGLVFLERPEPARRTTPAKISPHRRGPYRIE